MNRTKTIFLGILIILVSGIIAVWISYIIENIVSRVILVSACVAIAQLILRKIGR